ncbi:MAG TPA: mechanosensitive ion channel domain-containing protein [Candidatus Limnocylindria bacterium]|nr:mechanosensitive ion channel domain-containing protein [Candidatus Limnocylindria bacterium]
MLGNVIAGLTIIFTKPFRVGEHIEVAGEKGDVHAIELFSTTLVHPDRSRIIIPNRKIVGEILHNFGQMRQIHLTVMVPHGSDLTAVLALAREVVVANPACPRRSGPGGRGDAARARRRPRPG